MSILPLLVVLNVGVVYSRLISNHDDAAALQPILSRSQERRICTELCLSGLGGEPCGEECLDLTPQGLPIQSSSDNQTQQLNTSDTDANGVIASPRIDVCPVLCEYRLGYPLCNCKGYDTATTSNSIVDFQRICSMFCTSYNQQLFGCQECSLYKREASKVDNAEGSSFKLSKLEQGQAIDYTKIDWNAWCRAKCHVGDGGVACNCDLLPLAF